MALSTAERPNVLSNAYVLISIISGRIFSMFLYFFVAHSKWRLSIYLSIYLISALYYCSFLISVFLLFSLINLLYSVSFSLVSLFLGLFILTISASLSCNISFSLLRV